MTSAGVPTASSARPFALYDLPAPAKLNLFLHVTGRRPDGYHLIQSIFMLVDWCDTLHLELRTDGKIARHDLPSAVGGSLPAEDLTLRAARAFQRATGCRLGVDITLSKSIPAQAGMGGGSSDAATCLLGLQRLWGTPLTADQRQRLALELGADVPFFLLGSHAWVEGIGEQLQPIELPEARFVVVKPSGNLSTPSIFASPALGRNSGTATIEDFAANGEGGVFGFGRNDLQAVAATLCPSMVESLDWLKKHGLEGRMTGSGSAVFAPLPPSVELGSGPAGSQVRSCSNLRAHPLAGW
jgi:4-diphosphocytidyl-2-C-methyl-D-erythritol kinase